MNTMQHLPSLISIENGRKVPHTFSPEEYARRHGLLRIHMAEAGIDAVLFTSYHNICYYADFLYCYFGRFYGFAVTPESSTLISANIDGGQPFRRNAGERNVVYTDWQRDNYFRAVAQEMPHQGRIGIEFDHLPLERLEKLKAALPKVEFVDISAACMQMRMIKSAEEIALIKHGAQVCDIGGAALVAAVQEGVPEYEVALAATQAMVREIGRRFPHSELMDTWTWFQSGINTDGAHNPVTARKVQKGDIAAELNKIYTAYGLLEHRTFGYGHSFGVLSHYYGREAGLELREDINTVLAPGMVVSMEPMIMLPEGMPGAGGYREHDIVVITEHGADNITGFAYGPAHNIIPA